MNVFQPFVLSIATSSSSCKKQIVIGGVEKVKSINRKGGQALRNSPLGYFSEGARLQGWLYAKIAKSLKTMF